MKRGFRDASLPVRIMALVFAAVSVLCTQLPLLNYLGYEFSAIMALVASVASAFLTIHLVSAAYRRESDPPEEQLRHVLEALGASALVSILSLFLPLIIMTGNALFVRNCSLMEGFGFFLLLPCISALFGVALGFFCAVHYTHPRAVFLLMCLLLLGYSLALGYFTPAVYSYNFLYGYFPGLTYDEVLPISNTLVLFRLLTLLVSSVLVWMGMIIVVDGRPTDSTVTRGLRLAVGLVAPGRRLRTAGIVLALSLFYAFRCELGFEATSGYIRAMLGGEYRTEHFILYYSPLSLSSDEIRRAGAEHEFRLQQILSAFSLPSHVVFESYIYPSAEVKQRFIGAGNTDIAKPWSGQIHLSQQSLEASLKHELVHAAAAPFGLPVIRASASTGLVEGLAMALDGAWGNRTLHEYAAALHASGIAPDIRGLMSLWGFAAHQSSLSYVLAGSFCRYLIDRYGIRKMMLLYRSLAYRDVYGRSLPELVLEWKGFLGRVPLEEADQDGVDAIFRRPSIFRKVCARVLAHRNADARAAFTRRNYAVAESLYAASYEEGRGYEALAGRLTSALRGGHYGVLATAMDSIVLADRHPARYLPLFLSIGDAYWITGDVEKAYALYDRLYQADLTEGYTEATALRLRVMEEDSGSTRLLPLFVADLSDSVRLKSIDSLLHDDAGNQTLLYLKGRSLLKIGDHAQAAQVLAGVDLMSSDPELEALRRRMLGQAFFHLGKYEDARAMFWTSLNAVATEVAVERVYTWLDRCEWMKAHGY